MATKVKAVVTIDADKCKGCALCVRACPKDILEISRDRLNDRGYHPAELREPEECNACAACARTCPDVVITIEKEVG